MPQRPCLDCGRLTTRVGSRCPTCSSARNQARDARRGSRQERGYDRQHEANRATVLAQSTVCWICGHEGADQADDVIPKARGGTSVLTNLRPAHGTQPCPTCGKRCNQSRGARDVTPSDITQGDGDAGQ